MLHVGAQYYQVTLGTGNGEVVVGQHRRRRDVYHDIQRSQYFTDERDVHDSKCCPNTYDSWTMIIILLMMGILVGVALTIVILGPSLSRHH